MSLRGKASWGLAVLPVLATLGQGGADAHGMLVWHVWVAALVLFELLPGGDPDASRAAARRPVVGFLLFFAVAAIGAVRAPYAYAAWLFLLELAAFGAVAWLASRAGDGLLERIRWPIVLASLGQAIAFAVERFLIDATRPAGTMLNPNHLAAWLLVVGLLVIGDLSAGWSRTSRATRAQLFCLLPGWIVMFTIGSRGAVLGLLVGLSVVVTAGWRRGTPVRRRIVVALAVVAVVAGGVGIASRLKQFDPFRYQRIRIWSAVSDAIAERPWFGSGPRQFSYVARDHQFPDGDGPLRFDRGYRTTHSDWLRVPAELGWPAAGVLLLTAAVTFPLVRRSIRERYPAAVGAVAALSALVAQAAVENLSFRPAIYLLAALLLGNLISVTRDRPAARLPRSLRMALGTLLLAVVAIGDVAPYLGWRLTHRLPESRLQAGERNRLRDGLRRNPVQPDYWRRLARQLSVEGGGWDLSRYAAAREAAERSIALNPVASENMRELARVEARACTDLLRDERTRQRAVDSYEAAERVDRSNPFIPLELAGFLLEAGDPSGAVAAASRALSLEPESVRTRLLLAAALLETDPAARGEAERLLAEARDRAVRWRDWSEGSAYARELLTLDPADVQRLERKLAEAEPR